MRIGLTYDLRSEYLSAGYGEEETAEFDQESTIEAIEAALQELGHETQRVGHLRALAARLVAGERWDLVFNTAEGVEGYGREAQVPALLDGFGVPYTFSDPLVSSVTLYKPAAKRILRDQGVPTPDFRVVESEADLAAVDLRWPLFVKPVAEGTAKGIDGRSKVSTHAELAAQCRHILARFGQPALVETYLPGREYTVGVLGTGAEAHAIGTLEVVLRDGAEPHAYTYLNKERSEELIEFPTACPDVAGRAEELALAAWRGLGGRDAGRVDLREAEGGGLQVLEVNPLPGLHPTHSDLPILCQQRGIRYVQLIEVIVGSASKRGAASLPARAARAGGRT